ncbi:MAG: DNRLRE domain-containing protein [Bacteroidota bacterium]
MRPILLTLVFFLLFLHSNFSQKTIVLQPGPVDGKDTKINSAFPDYKWGTNPNLVACTWTYEGVFGIGRTLIRFDLSIIPSEAQILDAKLTLFYDPDAANGEQYGENASYLEKIIENWDDMAATWNTQPLSTGTDAVFIARTKSTTQDLTDIDITGFVSGWVLNPETNFGFMHRMVTEEIYCSLVYSSSNHPNSDKRPKLVVTYRDCDPPLAGFSYSTQSVNVSFTDSSSSANSWSWDFGDGYFSNLQNPTHVYANQGVYPVCLTVNDSCGSDTICRDVHVCEMPEPHFYYTINARMVAFRDSSTMPQSWYWDFGDGFYSDLKDPEYHYNESGTFYVCETVTNACSVQTFCDSVKIAATSVEDNLKSFDVGLYPNPAHDFVFLNLKVKTGTTTSIELFTPQNCSLGKWIREIKPGDDAISLNIAGLSKGIYFLQTKIGGVFRINKLIIL